jgi:chorismate mutase
MMRTKLGPPSTRRRFLSPWSELDYLTKKISYWLYTRKQQAQAAHFLNRLERVVGELPEDDRAILREEGLALVAELKGRLDDAIAHREREIELMERLHEEARSPRYAESTRAYMLRDRDAVILKQRRALVEALKSGTAQRNGNGMRRQR